MRVVPAADVAPAPGERVFRYSPARAVLGAALFAVAGGALLVAAPAGGPGWICDGIGGLLLLGVVVTHQFVLARFLPSNWLVRLRDDGLYVQLRSYLNHRFPAGDPTVLVLPFEEVQSARLVRERMEVRTQHEVSEQRRRLIELAVSGDTTALAQALAAEVARQPGDGVSTVYRHYPVRLVSPSTIRIEWGVLPRAEALLDALSRRTAIAAPLDVVEDLSRLDGASAEAQEAALRTLVATGQTVAAIDAVRRLHRCSLAEAKATVDRLAAG